ncbi:hypothetical protein BJV82DRAFT_716318 [Fennellomyces sp. T-0311]|nr:hypothetical protein BJV82DRAFT_716318 [Fennellomyces sp. T-0311]
MASIRFLAVLITLLVASLTTVWGKPLAVRGLAIKRDALETVEQLVVGATGLIPGRGTYFHPATEGGAEGACGGPKESDNSKIIAISTSIYDKSLCGKKVKICHEGKEVTATINDSCPGCDAGSLDMTPVIFQELDVLMKGVIDIAWCILDSPNCQPGCGKSAKSNKKKGKHGDEDDETT